jgi:hypothetical protein
MQKACQRQSSFQKVQKNSDVITDETCKINSLLMPHHAVNVPFYQSPIKASPIESLNLVPNLTYMKHLPLTQLLGYVARVGQQ